MKSIPICWMWTMTVNICKACLEMTFLFKKNLAWDAQYFAFYNTPAIHYFFLCLLFIHSTRELYDIWAGSEWDGKMFPYTNIFKRKGFKKSRGINVAPSEWHQDWSLYNVMYKLQSKQKDLLMGEEESWCLGSHVIYFTHELKRILWVAGWLVWKIKRLKSFCAYEATDRI